MVFGFLLFAAVLAFTGYWAANYYVLDPQPAPATLRPTTAAIDVTKDDCGYTGVMPASVVDFMKNNHDYSKIITYKKYQVDLTQNPDMTLIYEIQKNPADNVYELFTRKNPNEGQLLEMHNDTSIIESNFNVITPTIVLAHGWKYNSSVSVMIDSLITIILSKHDVNIIVLDWEKVAQASYVTALIGVPSIGRGLGQFLRFLNSVTGAKYSNMHLVGFGFGAHLVGNAGKQLKGKIGRITALDPAGPLWNKNKYGIKPIDGIYVEGIHTDAYYVNGSHGIGARVGHADFYPNGGGRQYNCSNNDKTKEDDPEDPIALSLDSICNHDRSWELFASTVVQDTLIGKRCSDSRQVQIDFCRGKEASMGNLNMTKKVRGMYRLNTRFSEYDPPDIILFENIGLR